MQLKNKKILLLHNIISPHVIPVFEELAKLVKLKVLFCAQKETNRSWEYQPQKLDYSIMPSFKFELKGTDLLTLFINPSVINEINIYKPNYVIISGWDHPTYWISALYCWYKNIPYIIWSGSTINENSWQRKLSLPLVKIILKGATHFFAYGQRARDYLISIGADSKSIDILYNSFYLPKKNKALDQKDEILIKKIKNKKVVMFYGQLIERKSPLTLISAFLKLPEQEKITLILIGNGSQKKFIQNFITKHKISNIFILDNPSDERIKNYYKVADILVLPSKEEVWGLVINQAMYYGVPVIASTKVGCVPDLVIEGKTGLTFSSESITELEKKLLTLLNDKKFSKEITKNAKQRVKITYPRSVAQRIVKSLSQLDIDKQNIKKIDKFVLNEVQTVSDDSKISIIQNPLLDFNVKRVYYIYDTLDKYPRGFHAHKETKQILVCIKGSISMLMDNGKKKEIIRMNQPNQAIYIDKMVWHEMHDITQDTIMLVLASMEYKPDDYIRDYEEFLREVKK